MREFLDIITASEVPEELIEAIKENIDYTESDRDSRFLALAKEAIDTIQDTCGLSVYLTEYSLILDCFPSEIVLPKPPFIELTSINYFDGANNQQTLAEDTFFVAKSLGKKTKIIPRKNFPRTCTRPDAVTVRFTAGAEVPSSRILQLIHLIVDWRFMQPGAELPAVIQSRLNSLRVY